MSEPNAVVDPDVPAPAHVQDVQADIAATEEARVALPAPAEDDIPEAVEVTPGQRMVPVGALKAVRDELRALKPHAERAQQLEAYVNDVRPYVEFLKNNPQILQPQQPQAPAAPAEADPSLVELARTLELYDPTTGQPDVKRAEKIRTLTQNEARQIAQQTIAPLQEGTNESRAAANLQQILSTAKDADGRALDQAYLVEAVKPITQGLTKAEALRVLADPGVANLIKLTALGLQASTKRSAPQPPGTPPLQVESPGGGSGFVMNEDSRKLAKLAGISEADYAERAKKFVPNRNNPLE